MANKNERRELEMKIEEYRMLALAAPGLAALGRITILIAELEQKLHEIDKIDK